MSDDDKGEKRGKAGGKLASSGRISPALLTVTSDTTEDPTAPVATDGRHSRTISPVRLSTELTLKVKTQMGRIATLKNILDAIPEHHTDTSLTEVQFWMDQLEGPHKMFLKEHTYFEVTWPAAFINHEYFATNVFEQEAQLFIKAQAKLIRIQEALKSGNQSRNSSKGDDQRGPSKLPDIALPKFSGDYSKWPSFRELFSSLILHNDRLSNIEKLHYLRGCMEGSPAQLIQSLPLSGDSLRASWDLLTARYENKRLLIQTHLDRLFNISTPVARDAASLAKLISTVSEANKALHSLGVSQDLGDCILVHHVSQHLDRTTRELWETSLGASQTYPRFQELEVFLTSHARALERVESTSTQRHSPPRTVVKKTMTAQRGTTQQAASAKSTVYACDCCDASHFIVTCAKFRELTPANRRKLAVDKWLCFNCLGRHNVRSCKSTIGCKLCSARHHTMLHETQPASMTTSTRTTPQPSTSQTSQ